MVHFVCVLVSFSFIKRPLSSFHRYTISMSFIPHSQGEKKKKKFSYLIGVIIIAITIIIIIENMGWVSPFLTPSADLLLQSMYRWHQRKLLRKEYRRRGTPAELGRCIEGCTRCEQGSLSSLSLSFFPSPPSHLFVCVLPARFHKLIYQRGIQ